MIISKHKEATEDYNKAYNIVSSTGLHTTEIVETANKKAFRKYISELSKFAGSKFVTRTISNNTLNVTRIQ